MSDCLPDGRSSNDDAVSEARHTEEGGVAEEASDDEESVVDPTVDEAIDRIRDRGQAVRDCQVSRALSELDEDITERERAVIGALGDRLVERLLAVPEQQLKTAACEDDTERFDHALELFG